MVYIVSNFVKLLLCNCIKSLHNLSNVYISVYYNYCSRKSFRARGKVFILRFSYFLSRNIDMSTLLSQNFDFHNSKVRLLQISS